jgi:hypothetical protein
MASDSKDYEMLLLQRALSDKCSSPFSLLSTTLLDLTGQITRESDYYSAYGGSADVWKGTWLKDTAERKVCASMFQFPHMWWLTSIKVAIKVVRVNNDRENGHEIMNKVRGPFEVVFAYLIVFHSACARKFWCGRCLNTKTFSLSWVSPMTLGVTNLWVWFALG